MATPLPISYSGFLCLTLHLYAIISLLSKKSCGNVAWIQRRFYRIFTRSITSGALPFVFLKS